MKILIADDDLVANQMLNGLLTRWGHDVIAVQTGAAAWEQLQKPEPPSLLLLDWLMPDLDGVEICRRIRSDTRLSAIYVIMLTSLGGTQNTVEGLRAGANDYVLKPFNTPELRARIDVGARVVSLHTELQQRVQDLEIALAEIKQLRGIIPICTYCKKIRDDQNFWQEVERYVGAHSSARFSHGICPDCYESVIKPQLAQLKSEVESQSNPQDKSCRANPGTSINDPFPT